MRIDVLDSDGEFNNSFFLDKKIIKVSEKEKTQQYSTDLIGFTHAEYVCSYILKENPEAEIILVPIIGKNQKCSVRDMIDGIKQLMKEQVDIINISLGDEYKYHAEIEEVCLAAINQGIIIVAAHSNREVDTTYPASFPFVIGARCLNTEGTSKILQYDEIRNDIIFFVKYFSLYHLGIAKFHQGNSFACAVLTGFISNYKNEYKHGIFTFSRSVFNSFYPYRTLKYKTCYFLTNRAEEYWEKRFIREITKTIICESFKNGMEKLSDSRELTNQSQVLFIDHNNYHEIYSYKDQIKKYAIENLEMEIVLRYPLYNMFERLSFQKETTGTLNQFSI